MTEAGAVRWRRARDVFERALERPLAERARYVEQACAGDGELEREVGELLAEDARTQPLLDRPVAEVAGRVLDPVDPPPRSVGPYRILSKLGVGGMGVVYLAERGDVGLRVAIKILRDASLSPERRARFELEQRILALIDDPAIARIYDAGALPDGTPYFVMEYVHGVPIVEYCSARGLATRERLRLFRDVCRAVLAMHRRTVVHRDLKPSNVLVTDSGAPRLLDFGIAKPLDSIPGPGEPDPELPLMTPAYAAPEQIRGEAAGIYTDVYALGVLLYELLAERRPFEDGDRTRREDRERAIESECPPLARFTPVGGGGRRRDPYLSRRELVELDAICRKATAVDPAARYTSVDALLREIDRCLAHEPLEARPDSRSYRLERFLRRHRCAVAGAAAVAALFLGTIGVAALRLREARDAAVAEAARTERIQRFMLGLFAGGEEGLGPPDTLRVATLLERGVRSAGALASEPGVQVELLTTLAGLYRQRGDLDRADSLVGSARRRAERALGPEHAGTLRADLAVIPVLLARAELEEAEREAGRTLARAERVFGARHPTTRAARFLLGRTLQERGAYEAAAEIFAGLADRLSERAAPGELSDALDELAATHYYAGNLAMADSLARRVVELRRRRYGSAHPEVADALVTLAAIRHRWGYYDESVTLYREALQAYTDYFGADHPAIASVMTMMAQPLAMLKRYEEASEVTRRPLAIREATYGAGHPRVATTLSSLGDIAQQRERFDEAERWFRRAGEIYEGVYGHDHPHVGVTLANLATVFANSGRPERAEPILRDALAIFQATLTAEDPNLGITRIKLGRVLIDLGRYEEAVDESLAGYRQLVERSSPSIPWLQAARRGLADGYEALGRAEAAERYRSELEEAGAPS